MNLELIMTFVIVFQIATSLSKPKGEVKHIKKKIDVDCKEISCPAVEDPVCMKIKNKQSNRTIYVMLLNKCEMGYMKCHKDVEGTTVPMKHCDHTSNYGSKHKSHGRKKRDVKTDDVLTVDTEPTSDDVNVTIKPGMTFQELGAALAYLEKTYKKSKDEITKLMASLEEERWEAASHGKDSSGQPVVNSQEDYPEMEKRDKIQLLNNKAGNKTVTVNQTSATKLSAGYATDESSENEDFLGDPEYDDKYRQDCPVECPSRVRLVCGRCDHGVYKTFLSGCHLRKFNCNQNVEKMHLVSRNSCISSSPLLTMEPEDNLNLIPQGKVHDRDDADPVLAFIRCRNRNSINVDDGLEIMNPDACKDIAKKLKQDADYGNK